VRYRRGAREGREGGRGERGGGKDKEEAAAHSPEMLCCYKAA